jgi:hypothetical protein
MRVGDEQILGDIFERDLPGIAGALEQRLDLVLRPCLLAEVGAVLVILELLLEVGAPTRLRRKPAFGDLKVRHAGLVKRIEKAAVALRIAWRIAPLERVDRRLAAGRRSAGAIDDVLAADGAKQFEARRPPAAPAEETALEAPAQLRVP